MKKYVIGICDDEKTIAELLGELVREITNEWEVDTQIRIYLTGHEVLEEVEELDLLFLDIDMPRISGIETGMEIKNKKCDCRIIMATGQTQYYKEAFKINAFRFVTKPFQKDEVQEALEEFRKQQIGMDLVECYYNRKLYKIKQRQIRYITAMQSAVELCIGQMTLRRETSLREMEALLPEEMFFQIKRGYIINLLGQSFFSWE